MKWKRDTTGETMDGFDIARTGRRHLRASGNTSYHLYLCDTQSGYHVFILTQLGASKQHGDEYRRVNTDGKPEVRSLQSKGNEEEVLIELLITRWKYIKNELVADCGPAL